MIKIWENLIKFGQNPNLASLKTLDLLRQLWEQNFHVPTNTLLPVLFYLMSIKINQLSVYNTYDVYFNNIHVDLAQIKCLQKLLSKYRRTSVKTNMIRTRLKL